MKRLGEEDAPSAGSIDVPFCHGLIRRGGPKKTQGLRLDKMRKILGGRIQTHLY